VTTIADSTAFKNTERVLAQHQAALTLLQGRLSAPAVQRLSWLDLACGRGQIIASLNKNLSEEARAKIEYWAYDIDQSFARETRRTAEELGFASLETSIGDLSDFDRILPSGVAFDFITLTNTVHEIDPSNLAAVLVNCVARLELGGSLFIYDMERVSPPELGAIPWNRDDVRRIILRMLSSMGVSSYRPEVGLWSHSSCNGWNVQLERQHFGLSRDAINANLKEAVTQTRSEVCNLLRKKLSICQKSLEALTICGPETSKEQEDNEQLLFEFWSLSRALEHVR
jgi:SAM-dependent methyltransferase